MINLTISTADLTAMTPTQLIDAQDKVQLAIKKLTDLGKLISTHATFHAVEKQGHLVINLTGGRAPHDFKIDIRDHKACLMLLCDVPGKYDYEYQNMGSTADVIRNKIAYYTQGTSADLKEAITQKVLDWFAAKAPDAQSQYKASVDAQILRLKAIA